MTRWKMTSTNYIDYVVIAGDTPKEILRNYSDLTGKVLKCLKTYWDYGKVNYAIDLQMK